MLATPVTVTWVIVTRELAPELPMVSVALALTVGVVGAVTAMTLPFSPVPVVAAVIFTVLPETAAT